MKAILIVVGIVLIVLIAGNPNINAFQDYRGVSENNKRNIKRTYNFVVISVYEYQYLTTIYIALGDDKYRVTTERYLGGLFNFYRID